MNYNFIATEMRNFKEHYVSFHHSESNKKLSLYNIVNLICILNTCDLG